MTSLPRLPRVDGSRRVLPELKTSTKYVLFISSCFVHVCKPDPENLSACPQTSSRLQHSN